MNQYFEKKTKKSLDNDIKSVQTYNDTCINLVMLSFYSSFKQISVLYKKPAKDDNFQK